MKKEAKRLVFCYLSAINNKKNPDPLLFFYLRITDLTSQIVDSVIKKKKKHGKRKKNN